MKLKKIFMSAALLAGCLTASAQQPQAAEQPAEAFHPHGFIQAQVGGQYTLGEVDFSDLLSGNFQVAGGYYFTPVWGLRLAIDAWQSKGGSDLNYLGLGVKTWKYNFIAPTLDVTCDLTNWICGYKADRVCNFGLLAGIGANIGWDNGEAAAVKGLIAVTPITALRTVPMEHQMTLLWRDTKTRFVGRFGAYLDFNVSRRVALGLEVNANATSDHYNSKDAGNADWYFNALAGVKVRIGKLGKKVTTTDAAPIVVEKIVEKIVEKPVEVEKIVYKEPEAPKREPLRRDIFFTLRGSEVSRTEMAKVEDVVAYLNKYPEAKVSVTGYADKGTGNARLNVGYAQKRAQVIANLLTNRFGISPSRITVDSKGDTVQPYEQNDLNRVTICIAE
ncbi:MAG: OmpA family protein [Bacteroidaceae bacterium]|nr:OmpA family protein [Bacteroidaceae bacterium]